MIPSIQIEDAEEIDDQPTHLIIPAQFNFQGRRRSKTIVEFVSRTLDGEQQDHDYLSDGSSDKVVRRRSAPLRLSIPVAPVVINAAVDEETTPQSESPETPASITTPIAGVVDLTKHVATTSKFAVAQGGLSDIYMGEWYRTNGDGGEKETLIVGRYNHHFLELLFKWCRRLGRYQTSACVSGKGSGWISRSQGMYYLHIFAQNTC